MPETVCTQRALLKRSSRTNGFRGLLFAGVSLVVICWGNPRPALSQSDHKPQIEASLLPPTTGEPLTIKPLNMQDIDCIVAEWQSTAARPVLTLICPPNSVFSPLRVLIKLSWMKPEDLPVSPEHILAPPGTLTKIRTNKTAAQIWLRVDDKGKPRDTWIGFTAVVDVALLKGRPV
jgi:hypothetical protein